MSFIWSSYFESTLVLRSFSSKIVFWNQEISQKFLIAFNELISLSFQLNTSFSCESLYIQFTNRYFNLLSPCTLVTIESVAVKIIYIIVFNCLYFMTLWSYMQTVFTKSSIAPAAVSLRLHLNTKFVSQIIAHTQFVFIT